jgi:uncharacterized protein (TIGR02611 family)
LTPARINIALRVVSPVAFLILPDRPDIRTADVSFARKSTPDRREEKGIFKRGARSLRGLRAWVFRRPGGRVAWRVAVAIAGLVVVIFGIVLLVIPGPGWVVIFLGLSIWATEFSWARSLLTFARRQVGKWTDWIRRQPRWLGIVIGGAGLVIVGAVVWWQFL